MGFNRISLRCSLLFHLISDIQRIYNNFQPRIHRRYLVFQHFIIYLYNIRKLFYFIKQLVNIKLALNTQYWTCLMVAGFLIPSIGAYLLFIIVTDRFTFIKCYLTLNIMVNSSTFYFGLLVSILSMFAFDFTMFSMKYSKDTLLNYLKFAKRQGKDISVE